MVTCGGLRTVSTALVLTTPLAVDIIGHGHFNIAAEKLVCTLLSYIRRRVAVINLPGCHDNIVGIPRKGDVAGTD